MTYDSYDSYGRARRIKHKTTKVKKKWMAAWPCMATMAWFSNDQMTRNNPTASCREVTPCAKPCCCSSFFKWARWLTSFRLFSWWRTNTRWPHTAQTCIKTDMSYPVISHHVIWPSRSRGSWGLKKNINLNLNYNYNYYNYNFTTTTIIWIIWMIWFYDSMILWFYDDHHDNHISSQF